MLKPTPATAGTMDVDSEVCEVCGRPRNLDRHHVVPRGMGGSKDPAVLGEENMATLCRRCHQNVHEEGWRLERSSRLLRVIDARTGQEVMRRRYDPDFDPATFFHLLNVVDGSLMQALSAIAYLDDEQLVEAFRSSQSLGKQSWLLQAAILHEAQRRSVHGDRSLEAIARRFEISLRQAEKYALVWRLFFAQDLEGKDSDEPKNVNVDGFSLDEPSWYVVAATESPEPRRWLAYAQDRKAENPRYSIRDFRSEIQQAVGATAIELENAPSDFTQANGHVPWDCPWVKPYCTHSGRPLPAQECPCEAKDQLVGDEVRQP